MKVICREREREIGGREMNEEDKEKNGEVFDVVWLGRGVTG